MARRLAGSGFNQCVAGPTDDVLAMRIAAKVAPPLTGLPAKVLPIIDEGLITGREIIREVQRRHGRVLAQSTLTRHVIPKLRPYGVCNDGDGYYRIST